MLGGVLLEALRSVVEALIRTASSSLRALGNSWRAATGSDEYCLKLGLILLEFSEPRCLKL